MAPISATRPPPSRERMRMSSLSSWVGARSAATTTCRPPSISEFSVWQNSCWMVGPCRNSMSSISRMSIFRSFSLKASASRARNACTKPLHEALGGEIEHLCLGFPLLHVPGDRMQEVGLAEAHIAVNEQRIEQRLRGGEGARDLLRRGVSEAVRGALDEAREAQPRVERRALKSSIAGPAGASAAARPRAPQPEPASPPASDAAARSPRHCRNAVALP